ncbi:hypothetical protein, partial [Paenilisteria weihenstephanensis]|uniref:hypothetical protein n=1 Tax=Listeria weihenstephanensis TaxID=1006155 RepID=UPI001C8AD3AC
SQPLEIFGASEKSKRGIYLRPLTNFVGSNGLPQLFVRSSFNGHLLENFTPSIKSKSGFSLRPLQFLSELNGPFQLCCGSYETYFVDLEPQYA